MMVVATTTHCTTTPPLGVGGGNHTLWGCVWPRHPRGGLANHLGRVVTQHFFGLSPILLVGWKGGVVVVVGG